ERRGERPDAMSAQSIQRAQLGAAPDHELLREVEIRAGEQYAAAQRRRVLQPVDDDVEIAALERGHEVGPVVLEKALTHAELRRERAHQVDLEADQLVGVAEAIVDVLVQANRDDFLTLKQLDAVLRRRDLRLDDAAVAARALELARPLGASDVVTGEVWLEEGQWRIAARRTKVAEAKAVVEAKEEGPRSAFPALAHKIGVDLFGAPHLALGPLTGSAAALEQAALCWKHLARQSLGAHARITLQPDHLAAAERACRAALQADPRLGLARAGLAVTLAA